MRRRWTDLSAALERPALYGWLALWWAVFLAPLLLASMSRPFAWWDLLTLPHLFHGLPVSWENLLPGYLRAFHNAYIVRPTTALMHDLQMLLFHGQFWLWYLFKWAAMGCALVVVARILRDRGASWAVSAVVVAYLLFHTTSFKLMLSAPDGFVALGALVLVWLAAAKGAAPFVLANMSYRRYAAFLAVFYVTLGIKEVAYAFCGVLVAALALLGGRRSVLRLLPLGVLMLYWTWLFAAAGGRAKGLTLGRLARDVAAHVSMLVPASPLALLTLGVVLLYGYAVWLAMREPEDRALILFCIAAALAVLVFTSTTGVAAARYVIPAIYLLAIPMGLALRSLRPPALALAGFLVGYPLLTAGDLFAQELAYQQLLHECGEALNLLEAKGAAGYRVMTSGVDADVGLEYQGTVRLFFGIYGPRFYGTRRLAVQSIAQDGVPAERFVLLSSRPAEEVVGGNEELAWRLESTERGERNYYGVLEVMTAYFGRFDRGIGNAHVPRYDNGAPTVSAAPTFYVHTFAAREMAEKGASNPLRPEELRSEGKSVRWRVPVGSGAQARLLRYTGMMEVRRGRVRFGIVGEDGREVWGVTMEGVGTLPAVPAGVAFEPAENYWLAFSGDADTAFVMREFRVSRPVEVGTIPRIRRYGAVIP
ncbi:MAG: hypothetical protein JNK87_34620 [Bryobacterales bacterium]|nr:hypothetical protein [Bryobacterales bacterium]